MSHAYITRRGGRGGGADAFAVIGAEYPEGSICTCSDGTKTLTAPDTSGNAIFYIPYAGTWTVTAVRGTYTANKSVDVTAQYQSFTLVIKFDFELFKDGVFSNDYTLTKGTVAYSSAHPQLVAVLSGEAIIIPEPIDCTPYSRLVVKVLEQKDGGFRCLGLRKTYSANTYDGYQTYNADNWVVFSTSRTMANTTQTFDLSEVNGSYYFKVDQYEGNIVIESIVFEA